MSILTHSPAIVRDGLVLCLDAGLNRSTAQTSRDWGISQRSKKKNDSDRMEDFRFDRVDSHSESER